MTGDKVVSQFFIRVLGKPSNLVARLLSLHVVVLLLGVMGSSVASGAEVTIENRVELWNGCNTEADTSIIRLQVQGQDKLPLRTDTTDGVIPSYPNTGGPIAARSDSNTYNTTSTTYRVVIEMGSWVAVGGGDFVQRRYTQYNIPNLGCSTPIYRYLDFTVTNQGPEPLRLQVRVEPTGSQYQVGVQAGTATLSTASTTVDQKTTTDFKRTDGPYRIINVEPVLPAQQFSVAENSAVGTVVGTLGATDPDGGPLTYRVTGGTGQGVFAVNPTTGQITVASNSRLDYETEPNFTLQVQTSDQGTPPLSASATITINLTNKDEVIPPSPPTNIRVQ